MDMASTAIKISITYGGIMNNPLFLSKLKSLLLPRHYTRDLSAKVSADQLLLKKGSYVFLAIPFSQVPQGDYRSATAKGIVRVNMLAWPVIAEKGLFLLYYGPQTEWAEHTAKFRVDKTALRPVILQSIHFLDPSTGACVNSRTHWGPIPFGFCGGVIKDLEENLVKSSMG